MHFYAEGREREMKKILCALLIMLLFAWGAGSGEEAASPVTGEELRTLWAELTDMARAVPALNAPVGEEDRCEDGYPLQYSFGTVYANQPEMTENAEVSAIMITAETFPTLRGIMVDTTVPEMMKKLPCDDPNLPGTKEKAVLYLQGDPESGLLYGYIARDGQRIQAIFCKAVEAGGKSSLSAAFLISDNSVDAVRLEASSAGFDAEDWADLTALRAENSYRQYPFSYDGSTLAMFGEEDLDFPSLNYLTAQPGHFGENVDNLMMYNQDGTWLRRVDGDGFEAVFRTDEQGRHAVLLSFVILGDNLEGPRGVRLGDTFQADFNRFRNGDGELDPETLTEVLYGTPGTAPWGTAEYADMDRMVLRYVTKVQDGREIELLLIYEDTILTEISVFTLSEPE